MRITLITLLIIAFFGVSFKIIEEGINSTFKIKVEWIDNLEGDFTFKEKWDYPEFVYENNFGQLSCDGDCPVETDGMKDEFGKIHKDSLHSFYMLIDTTHVFHSLKSENRMYEYSGTDFIEFKKLENGIVKGESLKNVSTHCSLNIELQNDSCKAWIDFNSIRDAGEHIFNMESGSIKIDKMLFNQGIIKAEFDFKFKNTLNADENLFWKGQIYSELDN